jgi:hypothetical protein
MLIKGSNRFLVKKTADLEQHWSYYGANPEESIK